MNVYERKSIGELLSGNSYPGRGIAAGLSADGRYAAAGYFIMGRSENSRNRVFEERGGDLFTRPFDISKVEDPSLILYAPIRRAGERLIISNGDQTDTIHDFLTEGKTFEQALETRCFEPDAPNYTPRISALLTLENDCYSYKMSILKSAGENGEGCDRYVYSYAPQQGAGHFIHTYNGDGNPLPSFTGEPHRILIPNDIDAFTDEIWNALHPENKISLHVRYLERQTGKEHRRTINKHV